MSSSFILGAVRLLHDPVSSCEKKDHFGFVFVVCSLEVCMEYIITMYSASVGVSGVYTPIQVRSLLHL